MQYESLAHFPIIVTYYQNSQVQPKLIVKETYLYADLRFEAAIKQIFKCETDEYKMLKFRFFFIEHNTKFWKNRPYVISELADIF